MGFKKKNCYPNNKQSGA